MHKIEILRVTSDFKIDIVSILDRKLQIETSVLRNINTGLIIGVHLPKFKPKPYTPEGGYEALQDILNFGGFVRGSYLYGFKCNHIGGHLYDAPKYELHNVENLECSCCSNIEPGRQWQNRDQGFGLCSECVNRVRTCFNNEQFASIFGLEGYHYSLTKI